LCLLGCIAGEDGGLDSGTISNSLVRVDALVGLLAVEEVGHEFDDTGDTGGSTNKDDFVDGGFVNFRVAEDFLDRLKSTPEEILAKILETCTGERGVEVNAFEERVDLD
jgi:hypothetical protein